MSGYTPIFDSVFQGSLCGKYPDLPVWLVLLALQQRGGIIDAHPSYISTISGIPQADIESAIQRFCEPDPHSRTPDHEGRRLEPIEGAGFGWRVINHRKYQEKARLEARNARETAERQAIPRNPPQSPAESRDPPLKLNTNKKKEMAGLPAEWALIRSEYPKRLGDQKWREAYHHACARLKEGATWVQMLEGTRRYAAYVRADGSEGTKYVKQASSFFGPNESYDEPWVAPSKGTDPYKGAI